MNNDDESIVFEILGQKLRFKITDGSKDDLLKISDYYKSIVDEIAKKHPNLPHIHLLCLSGLKVAEEFYKFAKTKKSPVVFEKNKINEKVDEAIKLLDISLQ